MDRDIGIFLAGGNCTQEVVFLLNAEEVRLGEVLNALENMASTGYANGTIPERSPEIRFTFDRNTETYSQVTLTLYRYDSNSCLVVMDGEATLFVAREDAVSLKEAVTALVLD